MKRNQLLLGLLVGISVVLIGLGVVQLTAGSTPGVALATGPTPTIDRVARISVQELHTRLQGAKPPVVWDIRSPQAYADGHIAGAQLVQVSEVVALAQRLDRNQEIVTLCA